MKQLLMLINLYHVTYYGLIAPGIRISSRNLYTFYSKKGIINNTTLVIDLKALKKLI